MGRISRAIGAIKTEKIRNLGPFLEKKLIQNDFLCFFFLLEFEMLCAQVACTYCNFSSKRRKKWLFFRKCRGAIELWEKTMIIQKKKHRVSAWPLDVEFSSSFARWSDTFISKRWKCRILFCPDSSRFKPFLIFLLRNFQQSLILASFGLSLILLGGKLKWNEQKKKMNEFKIKYSRV